MENLYEKAQQSAEYIQARITKRPKIAVVLGSGLGNLTAKNYRIVTFQTFRCQR